MALIAKATLFSAAIDAGQTAVNEPNDDVLSYVSPHFRASATVNISGIVDKIGIYSVGFIQAVRSMNYKIQYGDGYSSWEIKNLPVSDSDGNYPWYGITTQRQQLQLTAADKNKSISQNKLVSMNDNFSVNVTWRRPQDDPLPPPRPAPQLRRVLREQSFSCWLVFAHQKDATAKPAVLTLLRQADWKMKVELTVDVTQGLGNRCTVANVTQDAVKVFKDAQIQDIPANCRVAPNANGAQSLIWMPGTWTGVSGKIKVI